MQATMARVALPGLSARWMERIVHPAGAHVRPTGAPCAPYASLPSLDLLPPPPTYTVPPPPLQDKRISVRGIREHAWMAQPLPDNFSKALSELSALQQVG